MTGTQADDRLYGLIQAMREHGRFDHPAGAFDLVETHISYILLTGPFAYKFKKPVNLGFLDFSTLEKRKFYCEEELRLNRRLAPDLYVAVVPIAGPESCPQPGGAGEAIEYAVKMIQFPKGAELDRLLKAGRLAAEHIDELAAQVAEFHDAVAVASAESRFGSPESIRQTVLANISQIAALIGDDDDRERLRRLEDWTLRRLNELDPLFRERARSGGIRECHGDLHLGNIALLADRPVIFDCIEFSEELRWIDVMSEMAFLFMDLDARGQPEFAHRFLNACLEARGDYRGLSVFRFYLVYRALVRCKVACIRLAQADLADAEREQETGKYRRYLDLSGRYVQPAKTALLITHGLSGSGKTTLTRPLLEKLGAIRIRSDVERKRLHGLRANARTASDVESGIYAGGSTAQTYERLSALANTILDAGFPVIVDATFLKRGQRLKFRNIAEDRKIPFLILDFRAEEELLRKRISERRGGGADASEADLKVLAYQIAGQEPLSGEEMKTTVAVETSTVDMPAMLDAVREKLASREGGEW